MMRLLFVAIGLLAMSAQAQADGVSKETAATAAYCAGVRWEELVQTPDKPEAMMARVQVSNDLMQAVIEQSLISQREAQVAYDNGVKDVHSCSTDARSIVCQRLSIRCP
jgi:hypothetical protein